jgi:ribosomal protein S27E
MTKDLEKILEYLTEENYAKQLFVELYDKNVTEIIDVIIYKNIFKIIDWAGEDDEGEIITFVNNKIKNIHNGIVTIDKKKIYNITKTKIEKNELKRGDAPMIIFKNLDRQLKKQDYRLIFLCIENDSYIFTVVKRKNFTKLLKMEIIKFEGIPADDNKIRIVDVKCEHCGTKTTIFIEDKYEQIKCNCGNLLYDKKDETILKKCFIKEC